MATLFFVHSTSALHAHEKLDSYAENTENLWGGRAAADGGSTAISASMLGWGVGLGVSIAVLAAVLHQSTSGGNAHAHCH